jgi:hypothetical protein
MIPQAICIPFTRLLSLVGVRKTELSSGMFATLGELTGANKDSSELFVVSTISLSSQVATGEHLWTLGQRVNCIKPHKLSKRIQTTTKLFMISLNLNTNSVQNQLTKVSLMIGKVAVYLKPSSQMDPFIRQSDHGTVSQLIYYLRMLTGETWMVVTTCHGIRTSIFHATVAHAGHRALHLQLQIGLTF